MNVELTYYDPTLIDTQEQGTTIVHRTVVYNPAPLRVDTTVHPSDENVTDPTLAAFHAPREKTSEHAD